MLLQHFNGHILELNSNESPSHCIGVCNGVSGFAFSQTTTTGLFQFADVLGPELSDQFTTVTAAKGLRVLADLNVKLKKKKKKKKRKKKKKTMMMMKGRKYKC